MRIQPLVALVLALVAGLVLLLVTRDRDSARRLLTDQPPNNAANDTHTNRRGPWSEQSWSDSRESSDPRIAINGEGAEESASEALKLGQSDALSASDVAQPSKPKPFNEFFDSDKMYVPIKEEGPLTLGYFENGKLHFRAEQALFGKNWKRHGAWSVWHRNGRLHEEGAYQDGFEHGPWRWTFPNGNPMSFGSFDAGQRVGSWAFHHENGRVSAEGQYAEGVGVGHWIHFDEKGVKRSEGDFVNGRPDGHWVSYDERGQLVPQLTGRYVRGLLRD